SVSVREIVRLVPDEFNGLLEDVADGVESVVIAIRAGKNDDSEFHRVVTPWGIRGTSILARGETKRRDAERRAEEGKSRLLGPAQWMQANRAWESLVGAVRQPLGC